MIDSDLLLQAMIPYADKNVDFVDAFNAAWMIRNDVNRIFTFDQKHFNRFEGITAEVPL